MANTRCYDSRHTKNTKLLYKTQGKWVTQFNTYLGGKLPLRVSTAPYKL